MLIFLTGCGLCDINYFIMPDDLEFIAVVESLDTPKKVCTYVKDNFIYKLHPFYAPDPYILWKLGEGDCNDFETFARFVANYHGYETWRIVIYFKNALLKHTIAVFEEWKLTYSNVQYYKPIYVDTFKEVVEHWEESQTS